MKKVLFLDFDGVLFDTLREVYIVNRAIFKGDDFLALINEENYQKFSKFKYLVYNIWMFYYYNPIIFSNVEDVEGAFIEKLKDRAKDREFHFCQDFLTSREKLVKNHYSFWQNLEKPYKFFFEVKNLFETADTKIVIVSKKNKSSILQRFATYDFNLSSDDVYAREILDNYSSKGEFIKEYMDKYGYESAMFVDDNYNNLMTVAANPKVERVLALWGNSQPGLVGFSEIEGIEKIRNYCTSK